MAVDIAKYPRDVFPPQRYVSEVNAKIVSSLTPLALQRVVLDTVNEALAKRFGQENVRVFVEPSVEV